MKKRFLVSQIIEVSTCVGGIPSDEQILLHLDESQFTITEQVTRPVPMWAIIRENSRISWLIPNSVRFTRKEAIASVLMPRGLGGATWAEMRRRGLRAIKVRVVQ